MPSQAIIDQGAQAPPRAPWPAQMALGLVCWLAFLLALEPGNAVRAGHAGHPLVWDQETLRIGGASLLGALATPLIFALANRFPVEGAAPWRRAGLLAIASGAIGIGMVVASCLGAPLLLADEHRPLGIAIVQELQFNLLLVVLVIAGLLVVAHAMRSFGLAKARATEGQASEGERFISRIAVRSRRGVQFVEVAAIDWIESQGNYLALHTGSATHLIRETSTRLESRLDPCGFIRVHRRTLVAAGRITQIRPLAGGDAMVRLSDGVELRASRSYRQRLRALDLRT